MPPPSVPHNGQPWSAGDRTLSLSVPRGPDKGQFGLPTRRFGPLLGQSLAMRELFSKLARVAPSDASILIHGETGSGKELVARAVHEASGRARKPFIVVDCGAVSETLMDAELFGHTKGAFTGAHQQRIGALEAAHGGTVFLDEIGELPLSMQPKLLRVLESGTIRRVGESAHRRIDVRFVCATHRDLPAMVSRGVFREDLYFRLAVFPVRVPALRERLDDVELLVRTFAGDEMAAFEPALLAQLKSRPWRGNVRELRNFVERVRALGAHEALSALTESEEIKEPVSQVLPRVELASDATELRHPHEPSFEQSFRSFREQWIDFGEQEFVRKLLDRHARNVAAAASSVGVDRSYLYRLMRKHGL